jgi:hypothetical protein
MDALGTIAKFINSPPGQFAAGAALGTFISKCAQYVESLLTKETKFELGVWLLERKKLSESFARVPDTLGKQVDVVFGKRHFTWKCFGRSGIVSLAIGLVALGFATLFNDGPPYAPMGDLVREAFRYLLPWTPADLLPSGWGAQFKVWLRLGWGTPMRPIDWLAAAAYGGATLLVTNVIPDFFSLLETRWLLTKIKSATLGGIVALLCLDVILTGGLAVTWAALYFDLHSRIVGFHHFGWFENVQMLLSRDFLGREWIVLSSLFTSIWLWLYTASVFFLKALQRYDKAFDWFNRHVDIEEKPLQAIGLVAGVIVAMAYWAVAVVARLV